MSKQSKANYGQDAPVLLKSWLVKGGVLIGVGSAIRAIASKSGRLQSWLALLGSGSLLGGMYFLARGVLLIRSSRVGKIHAANDLLDALNLQGHETVLDVGCGHGVLLIGAAKRLPAGRAIGIDLWSNVDQHANSKQATLHNAEVEGVIDRVEMHSGDMRDLSFLPDAGVDAVVASYAIHNIPDREGRRCAIDEIVRVLRPGGQVALMDLFGIEEFVEALQANGMQNVRIVPAKLWNYPPISVVKASKSIDISLLS